ncbi:hypothetical protein TW84_14030 [Vibrio neptunius]|uniref:hypothetical protein n=1 Tax=Vibrio neptunius TaxID=170651 RepID=UPI0005F9B951|nr:hypothetical protein [Vibrio neptunius]KJY88624.1 hypothetical protein TW84_14030 [Vibrio neptunius]
MRDNTYTSSPFILLLLLTVVSALMYALGMVASISEQVIGFLASLTNYPIVITLFLSFKGVDLLGRNVRKVLAVWFVLITILEGLYPVFLYANQEIPSDYYTLLSLQILLNLYIAKVITDERNFIKGSQ